MIFLIHQPFISCGITITLMKLKLINIRICTTNSSYRSWRNLLDCIHYRMKDIIEKMNEIKVIFLNRLYNFIQIRNINNHSFMTFFTKFTGNLPNQRFDSTPSIRRNGHDTRSNKSNFHQYNSLYAWTRVKSLSRKFGVFHTSVRLVLIE